MKILTLNKLFLIFIVLFSGFIKAHKPKVVTENFGNVKIYFSSDFNYGSTIEAEELKIKAIGKLSEILSNRMNNKDTILIEYKVAAPYDEIKELFILESNNYHYKLPILRSKNRQNNNERGIAVRILKDHIDVIEILKLIEYTILNKNTINKYLVPYSVFLDEECSDSVEISVNTEDFIRKIMKSSLSELLGNVIHTDIELLNNGFMNSKIFWNNGEFVFCFNGDLEKSKLYTDYKKDRYKLDDFKYFLEPANHDYFIIFKNLNVFIFFDGYKENISKQKIHDTADIIYPLVLGRDVIDDRVILYQNFPKKWMYIYHRSEKLLQKIE